MKKSSSAFHDRRMGEPPCLALMRPLHRIALLAAVVVAVAGGIALVWSLGDDAPPGRPPTEVVVGESSPDTLPSPRPSVSASLSPSEAPGTDDGVVDPPPAVTGDDDDDDGGTDDDDDGADDSDED